MMMTGFFTCFFNGVVVSWEFPTGFIIDIFSRDFFTSNYPFTDVSQLKCCLLYSFESHFTSLRTQRFAMQYKADKISPPHIYPYVSLFPSSSPKSQRIWEKQQQKGENRKLPTCVSQTTYYMYTLHSYFYHHYWLLLIIYELMGRANELSYLGERGLGGGSDFYLKREKNAHVQYA